MSTQRSPSSNPREASREALAARLPAEAPSGTLMILRLLWGAFIGTQAVFCVVYLLVSAEQGHQDPEAAAAMLPVFAALALLMAGVTLFAAPVYAAKAKLDYMVACLLRFAIAEAVGIFGLTLGVMGLEVYPFAFFGASAMLILVQMPTSSTYQRYRKECLSGP